MGSSSLYRVTKGRQVAFGTVNTATHKVIRRSGGGHDDKSTLEKDGEVRPDLQVVEQTQLDRQASYAVEGFYSVASYFEEWEELLCRAAFAKLTVTGVAGDLSLANVGGVNKITSTTSGKFTGISAGQLVELVGFTTNFSTARKFVLVDSVTSPEELVADANWCGTGFVAETPALAVGRVIRHKQTWNGTDMFYNTLEERFASDDFQTWKDAVCESATFSYQNKQKCGVSFQYKCPGTVAQGGAVSTTTILTVDPTAATTGPILASKHVTIIQDGAGPVSVRTMGIQLNVSRPLVGLSDHGQVGDDDFILGDYDVTGTFNVYSGGSVAQRTATHDAINRHKAGTATALWWMMLGADNKGAWMGIPSAHYSAATRKAGGPNQPVMLDLPLAAKMGKHGYMFLVCEFD